MSELEPVAAESTPGRSLVVQRIVVPGDWLYITESGVEVKGKGNACLSTTFVPTPAGAGAAS